MTQARIYANIPGRTAVKILAIIGSPRKGNTFKAVGQIEEGSKSSGDVEFSYVHLKDVDLKPCRGCFQCVQKGHDKCPLRDAAGELLDKMLQSDGVIFATPAYNFNITSLMKNFIDRFAHMGHRPQFFNQHLLIVSTTAGIGLKEVGKYLTKYVGKMWGFRSTAFLGLVTSPYERSKQLQEKDTKKINKISGIFMRKLQSKFWSPKFHHIDQFCTMRALWTLEGMKEAFPKDHEYYNTLRHRRYYTDAKTSFFKYAIAYAKAQFLGLLIKTTLGSGGRRSPSM